MRKLFQIGGLIASAVLIAIGSAAIYMGFDGRSTVRDSLRQEQIAFGPADDPAVAKHAPSGRMSRSLPARRLVPSQRSSTSTRSRGPAG